MSLIGIGVRVIRGPYWKWSDEDGGEGGLGTVIAVKSSGQPTTVSVIWDMGNKSSLYRVGAENAYDLQVYDSGPIGIRHEGISCDACLDKRAGIIGSRYSCAECSRLDLCAACYHGDKHDLSHAFYRVDSASSSPVVLNPRRMTGKVHVRGFSIGAKVTRGHHWEWGNQDGGPGKTGRIISIEDGKVGKSYRSVAKILWSVGNQNIYRIGSYGKVDLKCVGAGVLSAVYRSHLPVLGQEVSSGVMFRRGDRVQVIADGKLLQHIQQSSKRGWSPQLLDFLGQVGIVHRVTEQRLVRVRFDSCDNKWTFDPRALSKVDPFIAGDFVYFIPDEQSARECLKGHGEWIEAMAGDLGEIGIVVKVYEDKDIRVAFRKNTWTLSPRCVELVKSNPLPESATLESCHSEYLLPYLNSRQGIASVNTSATNTPVHQSSILANGLSLLSNGITGSEPNVPGLAVSEPTGINHLPGALPVELDQSGVSPEIPAEMVDVVEAVMREVVRGNPAAVLTYLANPDNPVDCPVTGGKTLLHILAYQGCVQELQLLLSRGACVYYPDDAGDTALHYAAFGNQAQVLEFLIGAGAGIDFHNKLRHTPLHVAVFQNYPRCVQVLLEHGCNVNIQDNNLDSPLHDAVAKGLDEIAHLLLSCPHVDLSLENAKGFNALTYAVLRGNLPLTEKILALDGTLASKPKPSDRFTPLHVASYNDHLDIVRLLVEKYKVDVNAVDVKLRTSLMVAVGQGQTRVVNYLVLRDAELDTQDVDGNGVLHFLLLKRSNYKTPPDRDQAGLLYDQYLAVGGPSNEHGVLVAVFLFLVNHGAPLLVENQRGQKPLDLIPEETSLLHEIIEHAQIYVTSLSEDNENEKIVTAISQLALDESLLARRLSVHPVPVECAVCSELGVANVRLHPCNHAVACEECSSRMKKCIVCKASIESRVTSDGRTVPGIERCDKAKLERVNYLESKICEIEEMNTCTICMERCRNTIFLCGHGTCEVCARTLKFCHMCRKVIEQRINVFL